MTPPPAQGAPPSGCSLAHIPPTSVIIRLGLLHYFYELIKIIPPSCSSSFFPMLLAWNRDIFHNRLLLSTTTFWVWIRKSPMILACSFSVTCGGVDLQQTSCLLPCSVSGAHGSRLVWWTPGSIHLVFRPCSPSHQPSP